MHELLKEFDLIEFPYAMMLGDKSIFMYRWSTIDGLLKIGIKNNALQIIAINNSEQHNGKFIEFIELLESTADKTGMLLTVSDFFNGNLRRWFINRGYTYAKQYDTVIYKNKDHAASK